MLDALKAISEMSQTLVSWALAILAGTVGTIASTSHLRPASRGIRYTYLLFLPGWMCLAVSLYFSDQVAGRVVAAMLVGSGLTKEIVHGATVDFVWQRDFLQYALACFGLWLVTFLAWWVFSNETNRGKD